MEIPLNGTWQLGPARSHETTGPVPGLVFDPARIDAAAVQAVANLLTKAHDPAWRSREP